ncbi:MAG: hypothetical protein HY904_24455 [Deltaproteobacteria bacterium]|nr:hypothetical protein [Deltaproteobacteria bacterium]
MGRVRFVLALLVATAGWVPARAADGGAPPSAPAVRESVVGTTLWIIHGDLIDRERDLARVKAAAVLGAQVKEQILAGAAQRSEWDLVTTRAAFGCTRAKTAPPGVRTLAVAQPLSDGRILILQGSLKDMAELCSTPGNHPDFDERIARMRRVGTAADLPRAP